jgi:isopropylmalate/homocitrate/citramalate synthase
MTRIYFNDVVTRDGFQIEPNFIATDDKVKLIDELSEATDMALTAAFVSAICLSIA